MSDLAAFALWMLVCYLAALWVDSRKGDDLGTVQIRGSHWARAIADETYRKRQ